MPAKKRTPKIERRVLELQESGMSVAQIAQTVKLSITTIREILKRASKKSTSTTKADSVAEPSPPQPEIIPQETPDVPDSPEKSSASAKSEPLVLIPPIVNTRRPGRGRPPMAESGEVKRATTVAILPSVYEAARKICYVQKRTISEIINGFLESFVAENLKDLKKY
jgi:hypothetical protein